MIKKYLLSFAAALVVACSFNPALAGSGIVNPAFVADGVGAVPRSYREKAADIVNGRDYGMKCDGATDDYTALLKAVKTGKRIQFPDGVCIIGTGIDYTALFTAGQEINDIYWQGGGGFGNTTIKFTGAGVLLKAGQSSPFYGPAVHLKDLTLQGNGVLGHTARSYSGYTTTTHAGVGSSSTQTALRFAGLGIPNSIIENVRFKFWDVALDTDGLVYGIDLRNSTIHSVNIGWKMGATVTASTVQRTEFAGCAVGVWLAGVGIQNIQIINSVFEAIHGGAAILSTGGGESITVANNYFTANVHNFIHVGYNPTTNPDNGFLNKLDFYENFGASITLGDTVRNVYVHDNVLDSTGTYSFVNNYTHQPAGVVRRIVESGNYDGFTAPTYAPFNSYTGGNADEIIHGKPGARVYNGSAVTLTTNTETAIPLDSELWDSGGWHSTSSSNTRVTVDKPGMYLVSATLAYAGHATGYRDLQIRLNGGATPIQKSSRPGVSASFATYVDTAFVYKLNAGDYLEMYAYQNSGGNLDVMSGGGYRPSLTVQLIE